jgi:NitT/TauT family transport system permease protein
MSVIDQQPSRVPNQPARPLVKRFSAFLQGGAALIPAAVTFALGLAIWEGVVQLFGVPIYLLPAPSQILATMAQQLPLLVRIGLATFSEAVTGFVLGCTLGCLGAAVCVRWRRLADALVPLSVATNAVPIIALAPLLGIWLGSTQPASKVAVVVIMTFFPTLVSVYRGLISPNADALQLMHSYAAPQRDIFLKLRLPAALPYLFNALKVCATLSMIGAVVAEFFGGPQNTLGVYIKSQAGILRTREAWSAIVIACLLGIGFYLLIVLIERLLMPWHVAHRGR